MDDNPRISIFFVALLFLSFSAASSEDHEFSYDPDSEKGPDHWGDIRPEWYKCKNGTMQSPINLNIHESQLTSSLGPLQLYYHPSDATIFSTGHDIMVEWAGDAGYLLINGTKYFLQQCHWHSPSEHTMNGIRFDLEVHLVHESKAGQIAVIGVFYRIGFPNPFLLRVMHELTRISQDREARIPLGMVDPELVINIDRNVYYRYMGSSTTTPCHENVVWTIVGKVKQVSLGQIELLRVAVRDAFYTNARPLQPRNNRLVQFQVPKIF
ncbi:alpha carbonic anhydrase 7-like [Prosopis cineraria]|uniref:alpha carbonic anhydrase 7-like n=1 Tax=Prosopis cineraria TaxID=364024 RepID=UPI0024101575|nr:alpha carbonic anhydrase 7-like [Prosopis cineraria]